MQTQEYASSLIRPLAWEPPYAVRAVQEMAKRPKKKKKKEYASFSHNHNMVTSTNNVTECGHAFSSNLGGFLWTTEAKQPVLRDCQIQSEPLCPLSWEWSRRSPRQKAMESYCSYMNLAVFQA